MCIDLPKCVSNFYPNIALGFNSLLRDIVSIKKIIEWIIQKLTILREW